MKVCLAGVSCVGKTAIGARLAERLACPFYDLDREIETHFGKPLAQLKRQARTAQLFRKRFASTVLAKLVEADGDFVMALPPSGLMDGLHAILKGGNCVVIVLEDSAENILSRITFYDDDSCPITKALTDHERACYLREIKADMKYFGRSFRKADMTVSIEGLDVEGSAAKLEHLLRDRQDQGILRPQAATPPSVPPTRPLSPR